MKSTNLAGRLMRTTMLTGAAAAVATPVFAQDDTDDTIVVTGSRIERTELDAPSPITTVDAEQLTLTNTVNTEQFLNTLPQVIPAFDSTSNNPGNGTATVSLRGLGTNRTLVLVDGLRFVGSAAGGPVDLNNIPSALVERVDVVTGGASAVYGSDAVAGVVNFVLKDDFEGIQLNVSDEISAKGWDANIFNAALTMGGNFADGRGNAVMSVSYTNREALFQGDRDFSRLSFFDPGAGNEAAGFIEGGSSNIPGTRFRGATSSNFGLSTAAVEAFDPACAGNTCSGFRVTDAGDVRGVRFGNPTDLYNYAPTNYLQLPQERYSIFGAASYEINDRVEVYARGLFANSVVDSQLAPTPAGITYTVNLDNPALPADLLALFTNDPGSNNGDGTATVRTARRYQEIGTRNSLRDTSTFQISGGVSVDLTDNLEWKTEAQFGRSTIAQIQTGNISVSAAQLAVRCDAGPTASADPSCAGVPFADIFNGPGSLSPTAATFISRTGAQNDEVEQTQIISTLGGTLDGFVSPWASDGAAFVVGFEYREEYANSLPDSVLGPDVRGFNSSLPVGGRFDVYEAFFETDIPILQDSAIGDASINGAFRYSDYSSIGSTTSFAAGLDWAPIPDLRLRGQFQRAVRAPNIGELFSAATNGFPGAGDPCSGGANGNFSAATIVQTCIDTGVPVANVGAAFQSNGQIEVLAGGNPNLFEETADTWTVGFVYQPEFIDGLTVQADYYNIDIQDAISTISLQTVLDSCHIVGVQSFCDLIVRNPATGEIAAPFRPNLPSLNIASISVEGIDITASYGFDIGNWGSVNVLYYGGVFFSNGFTPDPITGFVECKGVYGATCGEPTPSYKHTMQATWLYGPLTTSLRWRYLPSFNDDGSFGFVSDLSDDIGSYNYLDVTMQYEVSENLDLTFGVQNITGKEPPVLGSTFSEQANTWPATYETLGRQLFFGATVRF